MLTVIENTLIGLLSAAIIGAFGAAIFKPSVFMGVISYIIQAIAAVLLVFSAGVLFGAKSLITADGAAWLFVAALCLIILGLILFLIAIAATKHEQGKGVDKH